MKMDLHEVAAFFVETVRHAERSKQPPSGMHVPYHGEFCSAPPSTMRDLRWFADRFEEAMRQLDPDSAALARRPDQECK